MRILLACLSTMYYNRSDRSFEHYVFYEQLLRMGHAVTLFDFQLVREAGRDPNLEIQQAANACGPDLILYIPYQDDIRPVVWDHLKAHSGAITAAFYCDDSYRFDTFTRFLTPHFHWVITTRPERVSQHANLGALCAFMPWGCLPWLHKPSGKPKDLDVVWVGQIHGTRRAYLDALAKAGIHVHAWGHGTAGGDVTSAEYVDLYSRARIGLSFNRDADGRRGYIKARNFEVPAIGTFMLAEDTTDTADKLGDYFAPGEELVTFSSPDELVSLVRYYLAHPTEATRIAWQAYGRAISEHTYTDRFTRLFREMGLT